MVVKVDPCLFMLKTKFFVIYVDDYLFWEISQSGIDNVNNYLKKDGTSYN